MEDIYSPGAFASTYSPEDYINKNLQFSIRNATISKILYLNKSIDQFGSGFKRINSLCKDAGIKYSYEFADNGFTFIFIIIFSENIVVKKFSPYLTGEFPVWWYTAPAIIRTFLEAYDFSGKVIVPFATSGGSGLGDTAKTLQKLVPAAAVKDGKLLNGRLNAGELKKWADNFEN